MPALVPDVVTPTAAFDCHRIEADSILLLDGGLDALRLAEVHEHFAACPRCAQFFGDLRRMLVEDTVLDRAESGGGLVCPRVDFAALAARIEGADLQRIGRLLYEILKAEFLYDYGDDVEPADEPISDPGAERARGAALVEELRDWVDGDEVAGVDLREAAKRFRSPTVDMDRLAALIDGMQAVERYDAALAPKAAYYVGLAHIKARRSREAVVVLEPLASGSDAALGRLARITLAVLPGMLDGNPAGSIAQLSGCLEGDAFDGLVRFNLAQACFEAAGGRLDEATESNLAAARELAPELVERQLQTPSARPLRLALRVRGNPRPEAEPRPHGAPSADDPTSSQSSIV